MTMTTILITLRAHLFNALQQAYPAQEWRMDQIDLTPSSQPQYGHYQCNSAMKFKKILQSPPRAIAEHWVKHIGLQQSDQQAYIERCEIAGPGFINITLAPSYLAQQAEGILKQGVGIQSKKKKRVVIDFSSPNTAKEMHVGHLRSTIIGDCLARLFEYLDFDVLRLNHIGDWGTAFGMLIAYLHEQVPEVLTGQQTTDLTHLVGWYRKAKQLFDEDPSFKKRSQLMVVKLQGGDKDAHLAWKMICNISRQAYQEIYDLLDVKLIERGESFYNPYLAEVVHDIEQKGLITLSDGAKCMFMPGFTNREGEPLPFMLQKSDGGYNYATTDVAAIRQRIQDEKADRIIYVTDAGQALHFQMLFKAAELAGYLDPQKVQCDHVGFGLVLGADGKKFRTRSGDTERLIDLLTAAVSHAADIIRSREPNTNEAMLQHSAKVIGIGAVKYADLSTNRLSDYTFSYERMLRFEGNTAPFILYAYVRIASIKRKIGIAIETIKEHINVNHPSEIDLALHIAQFPDVLLQVTSELMPNRLTDYLYSLAEKFNVFFRDCHVAGTVQQNSRLLLCEATAKTLKDGLAILGLQTLEKM